VGYLVYMMATTGIIMMRGRWCELSNIFNW